MPLRTRTSELQTLSDANENNGINYLNDWVSSIVV
jgi:hypothetical protein